jgi:spermidine synthase
MAGIVTMSLEFAASRLLIPVFGSSIYTWGSLIGVILAGLSLGYHIGGRLADKKNPNFAKFCSIIFSAGLYIVFIPFISPTITEYSSFAFDSLLTPPASSDISSSSSNSSSSSSSNQYASLFASFILLIIPTFLLGIVSPYAVKLATKTLSKLGNISGNLYSAATIGSIVGTFLTVFVLIPTFEIRNILFGLGLSLIISSAITGLGRSPKVLAGSVVMFLLLSNTVMAIDQIPYNSRNVVYQKETPYSHLEVVDSDNKRTLFLDGYTHSMMNKANPAELLVYTKYFPLGLVFNPDAKNILFVGGGGFSGPKYFLKNYPNVTVDVVEIDPVVIDVAKKYFNVNTSNSRLNIYNDDARSFLSKSSDHKYDIIILDAYSKNYVPFHLMTSEYYQLLYEKLTTPNGVIISNQIGSLNETQHTSNLYRAVYKTMSQVFSAARVYAFPTDFVESSNNVQNIILVATKNPDIRYYSQDEIRQRQQQQEEREQQKMLLSENNTDNSTYNIIDYADHLYDGTRINTNDVPLLTDQFAPVENLLNPVLSKPDNIEQVKGDAINRNVDLYSVQSTALTYVLPAIIVALWISCMRKIWKIKETGIN